MKETLVKSNSRKAIKYRGVECLNCGHPLDLTDRYCAYCGQLNTTKRLTLIDFFNEFMLSIFTYDSRFRHTLKDLLFKPGTITRHYVDGKRFHYANPFRFFLSASIFYFIILGALSFFNPENIDAPIPNINVNNDAIDAIDNALQDSIPELKGIPAQFNDDIKTAIEEAKKNTEERKARQARNAQIKDSLGYTYISQEDLDTLNGIDKLAKKVILFREFYKITEISDTSTALDSLHYDKSRMNQWIYSKNETLERVEKNPLRFINYLASKTPFFLFFFSPFFAFFFWLIYSKKKFNYMEHMVFIFHIFSWVFVVLLITLIPDMLIPGDANVIASLILTLIGPFYFYKALRNFYKQNRFITLIKFVFLNFVFLISTSVFAFIFFALTAAFY